MLRAAGLELRNAQSGGTSALSEMSRYSRIEPRLRTTAEREYVVHWIESKLPSGGIIDNLFGRCTKETKYDFVSGLKYRFYSGKTTMVWQNETAHEFFILINGSVCFIFTENLFCSDSVY